MRRSVVVLLTALALTSACSFSRQIQRRSNLMAYLYPAAESAPQPDPAGAKLQLPLKIGIAFVPPDGGAQGRWQGTWSASIPYDTEKKLLDIVKRSFKDRDWVGRIETIPSGYLSAGGGFTNLEQVARMLDVDVIALASIDQVQNSDPTRLSFLYLSVIGAYVLPLDRGETRTMIDVAVFDVGSRTFLLRAPGTSQVKDYATATTVDETLRAASEKGFEEAMKQVAVNLTSEVDRFKAAVATGERKDVDIVTEDGGSMKHGASLGWWSLLGGIALLPAIASRRKS